MMPSSTARAWIAWSFAVLMCLLLSSDVSANIGTRWWGDPASEPKGLKGIDILHEDLTIDMRPLVSGQPVEVEVIYQVRNVGAARKLDLLFVAGSEHISEFEVRIGDHVLQSSTVSREELDLHRKQFQEKLDKLRKGLEWKKQVGNIFIAEWNAIGFSVELPSGPSTLKARYRAKASGTEDVDRYPTTNWQLPYILAPAREWESFGELRVTAYVPEGWNSISSPNLVREGNVLHGNFTGLPADILTVAVQAPVGPELGQAVFLYAIFIVVTVVVGGLMCWTAGRSLGRILSRKVDALACRTYKVALGIIIWSILTTFLWEVFIITAWTISFNGILRSQAGQESPYFHEQLGPAHCGMALIVLAVLPIGLLITMRSAFGSLRRTH